MIRVCPHSDSVCLHGIGCTFSCATDDYDGTKRPAPAAPASPADRPREGSREAAFYRRMEIERIILRRLHEQRIDGYTLEMAEEINAILGASTPLQEPIDLRGETK